MRSHQGSAPKFLAAMCMCGGMVAGSDTARAAGTEQVAANGAYTTRFEIPVAPGPGAPAVSLVYDSASAGGVGGAGWDLSIGWPSIIARDTRFGTPSWSLASAWLWGSAPLIVSDATKTQCGQTGDCEYRLAPDNLTTVKIKLNATPPTAEVTLASGMRLEYAPVLYDGQSYPAAPAGAATKVLAFLLSSVTDSNGYSTCFQYKHFGDADRGRVAVLEAIGYGLPPTNGSCSQILSNPSRHRIEFSYADLTKDGYFSTWSLRFGAPVSFSSLLKRITVFAKGVEQHRFVLDYEGTASETRRPRLTKLRQQAPLAGNKFSERTLRSFAYGDRQAQFDAGELIDLGPLGTFPPSLGGSVSRPVRRPFILGNPNGIFQLGNDQVDESAPFTTATSEQWGWMDLNGDGLLDFQWARETGLDPSVASWPTFEPGGAATTVSRPPQQLVRISEAVAGSVLNTTPIVVNSHAASIEQAYPRDGLPTSGLLRTGVSNWIWAEGQGVTRTGMPVAVSAPEIRNAAPICPPALGQDSRLWPVYPDGTMGGSQGSIGDNVALASTFSLNRYSVTVSQVVAGVLDAYQPSYSVSSTLSGWIDLNGDGVPDFVATPGWIERFSLNAACLGGREPNPASNPQGEVDHDWHSAPLGATETGTVNTLALAPVPGPKGPAGLPIDYSVSTGSPEGFGFTLPIGSLVSSGVSALMSASPALLAAAVPNLVVESFSPRSQTGSSVTTPSPSVMGVMQGLASVASKPTPGSMYGFASSILKVNYDLTLLSATTRNRSETRAQLLDINGDGLPDYLLYNSGDEIAGVPKGSLLAYLNSPTGFGGPVVINQGFDYQSNLPMLATVRQTVKDAGTVVGAAEVALPLCEIPITPVSAATVFASCVTFASLVTDMAFKATTVIDAVRPFITATTDIIPGERAHLDELTALRDFMAAASVGTLATFWTFQAQASTYNEVLRAIEKSMRVVERTVLQLGFPSRLNVISRGFSGLDGSFITDRAAGFAVQTRGFVDLNGDGLPDYVITSDRERSCHEGEWEVFWGSGTSSITSKRAFLSTATCLKVPPPPDDVKSRGFTTLPLNVDRIRRAATSNAQVVDTLSHSYISLVDFNHDGRPDLLMAGEGATNWDPDAASRTWSVFLNTGSGFETTASLHVASPKTSRNDIQPLSSVPSGLNVPYPVIRTTHSDASISLVRDRTDGLAGLLDIHGDGVGEMVIRVAFTAADATVHDGLFVWRRSSTGPQDYVIEDRDVIAGLRVLVQYKAASLFQWANAAPDGLPPGEGHRALAGTLGHLVRSVTVEPLMGRAEQRTAIGYEYRKPYFDIQTRLPAAFALRTSAPLDPATGASIPASVGTLQRDAQRPSGVDGLTHLLRLNSATRAPVNETLVSYAEQSTTTATSGQLGAVFAGPVRRLSVEYPTGLQAGAMFDLGFDGREPFVDRARGVKTTSTSLPVLSPGSATGGAAVFNPGTPTALPYHSPHLPGGGGTAAVPAFSIEAWAKPLIGGGERTLVDQPGAYRLSVIAGNPEDRVQLEVAGTQLSASSSLPSGRWAHIVATFGSGNAKLFVNGLEVGSAGMGGSPTASGDLVIGCAQATAGFDRCFTGEIGELRIYPEAWQHPPRVSDSESVLELNVSKDDFGQRLRVLERFDLATPDDDVVTEYTYASPSGTRRVQGAISTETQRVLGSNGVTPGHYLGYAEYAYDALAVGAVAAGNPSRIARFDGASEVPTKPAQANVVTQLEYTNPNCPGKTTRSVDPEGFVTSNEWDATCTFVLSTSNALGHRTSNHYYGVDVSNQPTIGGPYGSFDRAGKFGQPALGIDANGAATTYGYDEWGRLLVAWMPLDRGVRPSRRNEFSDAQCQTAVGKPASCDTPGSIELASPARVTSYSWDDQLDRCKTSTGTIVSCADATAAEMAGDGAIGAYRVTHAFGDGQVQAQTIQDGKPAWKISGTKDFDAQGHAMRNYRVRYLPTASTATTDACPPAGAWCDSRRLKGDPLRDGVATVQTAHDDRGRVVRVYGPGVPSCGADPSVLGASGIPACDSKVPQGVLGHVTWMEYPSPGALRITDARGVPAVTRLDARGLTASMEEYDRSGPAPYASVRRTYDRLQRLVQTVDHKNNTSTAAYDALGRLIDTTDPDTGETKLTYDSRGLLTKQVVATGDIARHAYDALGRLVYSEYRRSKPGSSTLTIDQCKSPERPCDLRPGSIDMSRYIDVEEFFSRFLPVPPRPPVFGPHLTALRPAAGSRVATFPLPFDVTLTPNAIWAVSDVERLNVRRVPGSNLFRAGTRVYVNTNGKIRFDAGGVDDDKPATADVIGGAREIALYPFFSDLTLRDGGLRSGVIGDSPNRELVIQWSGALRARPDDRVEFRVVISEASSEVRYEYDAVPADVRPIVGAQNHSLRTARSFVVRAFDDDGEPFLPASRTALSSQQVLQDKRFAIGPALKAGVPGRESFELTVPLAKEGELGMSFRHRWFSRCGLVAVGACEVDRMTVGYRDPQSPRTIRPLVPADRLTSNASLDQAGHEGADEIITAALPRTLAGKEVTFVFGYDPVTNSAANQRISWLIDQITILGAASGQSTTLVEGDVEEKVWREHDSAESPHSTADPSLLTDLTFDVPGRIADRSPLKSVDLVTLPSTVESIAGASGNGVLLNGHEIALNLKNTALPGLTVEAWVQPGTYPASWIRILTADNVFSLSLLPDGRVGCGLTLSNVLGTGYVESASALPTDSWTHVALSYDGTALRCFINGAVDGQSAVTGTLAAAGSAHMGDSGFVGGVALDEVRLYASALSPQRVLLDALRPLQPGPPRGNLVDLRFSDPGNRGLDASRGGNNAALTGGQIVPGVQGAAFLVNGGQVTVPHNATLRFVDTVTAELWLKTRNHAVGPARLIEKWPGGGPGGWRLGLEPFTGRLRWEILSTVTGPNATYTAHAIFVTRETINNDGWHHVAATYDGRRLRVFIDGVPAHRTCSPVESANNPAGICNDIPPPDQCAIEVSPIPDVVVGLMGDAVCSQGIIDNTDPIHAGLGFDGVIDEVRVSNYAKREFEVSASSRMASQYTRVLGREVDLRNELPVGTQIAREVRAYDVRGHVVSSQKRIIAQSAGDAFLSRRAWDTSERAGSEEYPDGEVVVSRFDHSGLQINLAGFGPFVVGKWHGRQDYLTSGSATLTGSVGSMTYGNGVSTVYSYDDGPKGNGSFGADWLSAQSISTSNAILSQRAYGWSVVGDLETATDTAQQYSASYGYDDLSRVTSATFDVAGATQSRSYGYDSIGNLTLMDGVTQDYGRASSPAGCGAGGTPLPHAVTKRTTGATVDPLCYDEVGRLVRATDNGKNSIRNHSYSARGKMSRLSDRNGDYAFWYDGDGARVVKTELGANTIEPHAHFRETASGVESIFFANGRLLARRTGPAEVYWYHSDQLGGTNLMTDASGGEDASARSQYLPFGNFLTAPNRVINRSGGRQFTGKELDGTDLYDYGSRYFDPTTGRFIQPDSIIPGRSVQARNRYSYALNSPDTLTDPDGRAPTRSEPDEWRFFPSKNVVRMPEEAISGRVPPGKAVMRMPEEAISGRVPPGKAVIRMPEERIVGKTGLTRPPLISAPPAVPGSAVEPTLRPFNPEMFLWASYEKVGEVERHLKSGAAVKAEGAMEAVLIFGANNTGPFDAQFVAIGAAIGVEGAKRGGYGAVFGGQETVTQYVMATGEKKIEKEPIILVEGGVGPAVAGAYQTGQGHHGDDTGSYLGVRAGPWAAGFGLNLDFLRLWCGPICGPAQTDNPWFQGPGGLPIQGP
jgi:RHS repeat-associated protein